MRNTIRFYMWMILFLITIYIPAFSQGGYGGHLYPDSLTLVTVSGIAIVDSSMMYPMYFLDENNDDQADYQLNFGPYWYEPDSSNATRPNDGDAITITGGQYDTTMFSIPGIVVYEINGEFWRDPYDPFWNGMGYHTHTGGHHQGSCNGFAFGWMHDTLQPVSVSGTALVDTTFAMELYFLDENGDNVPDYSLNFGPPWYQPVSGATRPNDGEQISIVGGRLDHPTLPMIIVYEINGLVWRDSTQIGPHFGGGWIHRNMSQSSQFHTPFDPQDWMQVNPGWYQMGGGHHGGMMPDSLFCQILELYPENIPFVSGIQIFAGYEIGMFAGNGTNTMWQGGTCGGHMNFGSNSNFQMHYNDIQLQGYNIDETTIQAKYWDDQASSWITLSNTVIDPSNNTVTFSTEEIGNFIILTGQQLTRLESEIQSALAIDGFFLEQNFPNPFNPKTTINFYLKNTAKVSLTVYNSLGQWVENLVDEQLNAGSHSITFGGNNLPSGIYFYELKVDEKSKVLKMNLMK